MNQFLAGELYEQDFDGDKKVKATKQNGSKL
jgi:hypothetical protein